MRVELYEYRSGPQSYAHVTIRPGENDARWPWEGKPKMKENPAETTQTREERISRSPRRVHRGTNFPRSRRAAPPPGMPDRRNPGTIHDLASRINIDHRVQP